MLKKKNSEKKLGCQMVSFVKEIVNMLIRADKYLNAILYGAIIIDCAYSRISGQFHSLSSAKYMYTIYFANALSKKNVYDDAANGRLCLHLHV